MRDTTIARNYAEALLALARKADNLDGFGKMIREVANAMQDQMLYRFLESPRVNAQQKTEVLTKAYGDRVPRLFLRFLQSLVSHRRQMLIPEIATEYETLLDQAEGRVHANLTVARPMSDNDMAAVTSQLSKVLGKTVVPHTVVNPEILGGVVVKVGDTVMDGSVRRRLQRLRGKLLSAG